MKVSINWIKQYIDFELPAVDELVERIGAQLGAVEEVIDLGKKYQGVLIVKVVECYKHENSDHLSVCKIDDGGKAQNVERDEHGHVQVVCGAPNVRQGLTVAWLLPGSTVPATVDADPFVLEARELRGVVSNGMLASAKELAIGDSHEGLAELEDDLAAGADFATTYQLNDYIIDIENKMFTHRPDCFGELGVAREIAGIFGKQFHSIDWYTNVIADALQQNAETLPLQVRNEVPGLVPRFMAVALSGITVKPSPFQLQTWLSRVGIRPINNVVDVTNYMMMASGQPLHAYDYDKVKAEDGADEATLVVRNPRPGEKITLLNGKEVEPRSEAIMIATENSLIGLGGIMGGADTEVTDATTNIILEAATFDMYSIRKISMAHGIFSDAVTRFNKGQSPLQNDKVLAKSVELLKQYADGTVASSVVDDYHLGQEITERNSLFPPIPISTAFVNDRLGLKLAAADMAQLLSNVECRVELQNDELSVTAPFWRTDVEVREDVVEEVGRLYGFDKLPLVLPLREITPATKDPALEAKRRIRAVLSAAGANEVLTYSFVHGNLLDKVGQSIDEAFRLSNALSPDLQYYRVSMMPSLLEKVHMNIKSGYDEFALFEIGKVHGKSEIDESGVPHEFDRIALVFASDAKRVSQQYAGAAYYEARQYSEQLFESFGLGEGLQIIPLSKADLGDHLMLRQMVAPYEPDRSAILHNGRYPVGIIGEFKRSTAKALKLPEYCAGFELFLSTFTTATSGRLYQPLPRYPKVEQDISLKVPVEVTYQQLYDVVWNALSKVQPDNTLPNLSPLDIYQRDDDTTHKQITLRFSIASFEKTMTDQEVNAMLDAAATAANEQCGAERL